MPCQNILVLGGTGFVGRCVVAQLAARGCRVAVPTRRLVHGRPLQVLPTVEVIEADVHDPATLQRLLAGRDAVVNLVGILHDSGPRAPGGAPYGAAFAAAHVTLVRALAAACAAQGVHRVVHVSALGADPAGPSGYLRSKGDGERVIAAAPLASTILRPSVVFGAEDRFLNLFAALAAVLPALVIGGADSRLQPVWVQDLAGAIAHALDEPATIGRSYEICGPAVYTLRQLVAFAARASGHPRPVIGLPRPLAMVMAFCLEHLPVPTVLSRDNLRSLAVDSVASVQPYRPAAELGFLPSPLEPEASLYLSGLHPRTRFGGFRARAGR